MKKHRSKVWFVLLLVFSVSFIYNTWDNNRIKVVEQEINIEGNSDLDGFTIVQVTDLHEKEFGENQTKLIAELNAIDYDVIVFTGDMLISSESKNYKPFLNLIEGIENKKHALFVPGNSDPHPFRIDKNNTYKKDEFIEEMEKRGVKWLESIYTVNKKSAVVQIVDFENSLINQKHIESLTSNNSSSGNSTLINRFIKIQKEMEILHSEEKQDLLIALNHYPVVDQRIDLLKQDPFYEVREYDLLIAGHYHGGQYRLPFFGAIFVPEPYYERSGLFPPQNRVKGLWEYNGIKQYVSAGLGSSNTIPFMKFRLFNTPEINVIVYKNKEE